MGQLNFSNVKLFVVNIFYETKEQQGTMFSSNLGNW